MSRLGVLLIFGALVGALIFGSPGGSRGLLHLRTLKQEQGQVQKRITRLLEHNAALHERLRLIRTDDRHLEGLARAQLGLVRPGELVYRFGASPKDPAP